MANRVVLGAFDGTHVLRVSRPGFNVLSTGLTPKQLAFDSRWQESGNVFMSGNFSAPATGSWLTIPFGTTFNTPPLVLLRIIGDGPRYLPSLSQVDLWVNTSEHNSILINTSNFQYRKGQFNDLNFMDTRTVYHTVLRNVYG